MIQKTEPPAGGVGVTMVGVVLIGMSQWSSIKISATGVTPEALANAVDEIAAQVQNAASGVEATSQ